VFQNILFAEVENSAMTGNVLENATYGIGVLGSLNVTVSGNLAQGNTNGLAATSTCTDVHFTENTVRDNGVGIGFEYATGYEMDCSRNVIQGHDSGANDVGIVFTASRGIEAHDNTISGLYEGIWIYGGDSHTVSNTSIDTCRYGIEISPLGGFGEPEPAWNNTVTGNEVMARRLAFLINGPEYVYGNRIYLNNFSSEEDPALLLGPEAPDLPAENPFSWGLLRRAPVSPGLSSAPSLDDDENIFQTDTPVTYRYQGVHFTGYLGNHWNRYNGTDSGGNGVGTTPCPVFLDNADDYPLIGPVSDYTIGTPPFYANFTASPLSGPVLLKVAFTDTSTGHPDFWSYTFGDGSTSSAKSPVHTYQTPGNYTVSLTIWKMEGQKLVRTTTRKPALVSVTGTPAPALAADFTASPLSGPAPLAVAFTDTSTGHPDFWSYTFGDGSTSSAKSPVHTYRAAGTYTVTLTVMKVGGDGIIRNTTEKRDLVTVSGTPVSSLAANFTASPLSGPVPLKVAFTDTSTGNPQFWNYKFGDGTSSTDKNPAHTYLLPGNYTVTLTVNRMEGSTLVQNTTVRQNLVRGV
jgi:parallel beta-helix repeat protein